MLRDPKYWLGFSLVPEIGPKRLAHLLNRFGAIENAWTASERQLLQAGLEKQPTANLLHIRKQIDLEANWRRLNGRVRGCLHWRMMSIQRYSKNCRMRPQFYMFGEHLPPDDENALAIVGTRRARPYGRDAAYHLSKQLAAQGVTVISGLAHGVDSAAHKGALDGGGRTIAVLGCGVDMIYPSDQGKLAQQIMDCGALISEFPIGMHPEARNFPRRNRVISGLSLGVLVVEAPEKSGAMITAYIAADQGREVFAVPGNIFNPMSAGTNRLIQDGAKLVMSADDILNELKIAHTAGGDKNGHRADCPGQQGRSGTAATSGRRPGAH